MSRSNSRTAEDIEAMESYAAVVKSNCQLEVDKLKGEIEAIREESQAIGILKKIDFDTESNELLRYAVLMRIKQSKSYRKGGLTWDDFCEQIAHEPRRTVDRKLEESRPVLDRFSANLAEISGVDFSNIRMLGRAVSANLAEITDDAVIIIGDNRVPIAPEYASDIKELIEGMKDDMNKQLANIKGDIRARDRRLEDKEKDLQRLHKQLDKLEDRAATKGLTSAEDAFIQQMQNARISADGFFLKFDPERNPLPDDATARMKAEFMITQQYLLRVATASYHAAVDYYGEPGIDSSGWVQPNLRTS